MDEECVGSISDTIQQLKLEIMKLGAQDKPVATSEDEDDSSSIDQHKETSHTSLTKFPNAQNSCDAITSSSEAPGEPSTPSASSSSAVSNETPKHSFDNMSSLSGGHEMTSESSGGVYASSYSDLRTDQSGCGAKSDTFTATHQSRIRTRRALTRLTSGSPATNAGHSPPTRYSARYITGIGRGATVSPLILANALATSTSSENSSIIEEEVDSSVRPWSGISPTQQQSHPVRARRAPNSSMLRALPSSPIGQFSPSEHREIMRELSSSSEHPASRQFIDPTSIGPPFGTSGTAPSSSASLTSRRGRLLPSMLSRAACLPSSTRSSSDITTTTTTDSWTDFCHNNANNDDEPEPVASSGGSQQYEGYYDSCDINTFDTTTANTTTRTEESGESLMTENASSTDVLNRVGVSEASSSTSSNLRTDEHDSDLVILGSPLNEASTNKTCPVGTNRTTAFGKTSRPSASSATGSNMTVSSSQGSLVVFDDYDNDGGGIGGGDDDDDEPLVVIAPPAPELVSDNCVSADVGLSLTAEIDTGGQQQDMDRQKVTMSSSLLHRDADQSSIPSVSTTILVVKGDDDLDETRHEDKSELLIDNENQTESTGGVPSKSALPKSKLADTNDGMSSAFDKPKRRLRPKRPDVQPTGKVKDDIRAPADDAATSSSFTIILNNPQKAKPEQQHQKSTRE
ncbi:hypothetical protein GZH46_01238, partial [Fragariocoptes setiger]